MRNLFYLMAFVVGLLIGILVTNTSWLFIFLAIPTLIVFINENNKMKKQQETFDSIMQELNKKPE